MLSLLRNRVVGCIQALGCAKRIAAGSGPFKATPRWMGLPHTELQVPCEMTISLFETPVGSGRWKFRIALGNRREETTEIRESRP
jgi:hypothetical protein